MYCSIQGTGTLHKLAFKISSLLKCFFKSAIALPPAASGLVGSPLERKVENKGKGKKTKTFFFLFGLGAGLTDDDVIEQRPFNALGIHKDRKSPC